jgi:hypothetical protein
MLRIVNLFNTPNSLGKSAMGLWFLPDLPLKLKQFIKIIFITVSLLIEAEQIFSVRPCYLSKHSDNLCRI